MAFSVRLLVEPRVKDDARQRVPDENEEGGSLIEDKGVTESPEKGPFNRTFVIR
jgi:hypothetical protein